MILDPVTIRWAGALYNLAARNGVLDEVGRDVERIGTELSSPAVRTFLLGGDTSREDKRARFSGLASSFHPFTKNFVALLFDRRREEVLFGFAEAFRRRVLAESGEVEGWVESPRPLGTSELDQLATAMGARLEKKVRLEGRTNPELVGGVRVFVGANMIDHSVQGRLEELRRRMLEAPLPVGHGS